MDRAIALEDVRRAAERIAAHVHRTPVLTARSLDACTGAHLLLKAECLQRGGSFKVRGAFNAVLAGLERGDRRDLLAVSSGNHAQAVAIAAREVGLRATIVMPQDASALKRAATLAYGAEVIDRGIDATNREAKAHALAAERDLRLVHPFDDPEIMAGQGTLALELLEQAGERAPDLVLVPVGGGGLISGVATVIKAFHPRARVIGVEPALADDAARSWRAGHLVSLAGPSTTIADGVRTMRLGERPWSVIREVVDEMVTVTEEEILAATQLLWTRTKLLVEPTGALPVAALLAGHLAVHDGVVVACVLSGGNADPGAVARLFARSAAGSMTES